MNRFYLFVLIVLNTSFGMSSPLQAQSQPISSHRQAIEQHATDPLWLKLAHIEKDGDRYITAIIDESFYFSNVKQLDPKNELIATIEAFTNESTATNAQCRFPARKRFIKRTMPTLYASFPDVQCPEYDQWFDHQNVDSVSLIFATGYLDNPASYYGHLLLKFNNNAIGKELDLLDQSLNFGADVPENENPLFYIFFGLTGGYEAVFSDEQFYRHHHSYGEIDLRDIWEYELTLSKDEVMLLIDHSWELVQTKFTYYFLKENCAFRMAELLEVVLQEPLLDRSKSFVFPFNIFERLNNIQHNGQSIVKDYRRIPSRHSRFIEKYQLLSKKEQRAVQNIVEQDFSFSGIEYTSLSEVSRSKVIEMLIDYVEYRKVANEEKESLKPIKSALLFERLKLPAKLSQWQFETKKPPHLGQKSSMLRLGARNREGFSNDLILSYRPAYYDFLTVNHGRMENSKLINAHIDLAINEDEIKIDRATLLEIHTLNISQTGLPHDGGFAWNLYVGYEPITNDCTDCKIGVFETGIGKGFQLTDSLSAYVLADFAYTSNHQSVDNFRVSMNSGILYNLSDSTKMHLEYRKFESSFSELGLKERLTLEARFGAFKTWDFRIKSIKDVSWSNTVSFAYYF